MICSSELGRSDGGLGLERVDLTAPHHSLQQDCGRRDRLGGMYDLTSTTEGRRAIGTVVVVTPCVGTGHGGHTVRVRARHLLLINAKLNKRKISSFYLRLNSSLAKHLRSSAAAGLDGFRFSKTPLARENGVFECFNSARRPNAANALNVVPTDPSWLAWVGARVANNACPVLTR